MNVRDDASYVDAYFWVWDYDPDGTHENFAIDGSANYARIRQDLIRGAGYTVDWSFTGDGIFRANPLRVRVATVVPSRIDARLVVPADHRGVYNVTDTYGQLQGRRYVGETRFVPVVLNVTTPASWRCLLSGACDDSKVDPKVVLVPRSVFYETELDKRLAAWNPSSPLDKLELISKP